jgi:NAD+ kinase
MAHDPFDRIGLVVHPRRELDRAIATVAAWTDAQGAAMVQIRAPGQTREVAPAGEASSCDLVIALGGDGTTLAALHAAAPVERPVLGVACGSLGALTAVTADRLSGALDRVAAGDWTARTLPAVATTGHDGARLRAVNDLVLVRRGAGQVAVEIDVDGERYIRFAGDGLVASTPLGSTAYTLAAGGPMLAPGSHGLVLTPLAPHGGVCPPLVTTPGTRVVVTLNPGHGGARLEVDGQIRHEPPPLEPLALSLDYEPAYAALVSLGEHESLIAGLRRRRILLDSPRVLARDDREAAAAERAAAAAS